MQAIATSWSGAGATGAPFVFELSKVERPNIRARVIANLRNVDADLAHGIASGLGLMLSRLPTRPLRRRSPTCLRPLRSASSPTGPCRSPGVSSVC